MSEKFEHGTAYYLAQKPYDVIAAINRIALATGDIRCADAGFTADYNGHHNIVHWNDYRGYYVGEFFWAGRHVFIRDTDFNHALRVALAEFDRQGLGAALTVVPLKRDEQIALACPRLLTKEQADVERAKWWTWKHDEAAAAIRMERLFGTADTVHLIAATSPEDYRVRRDAEIQQRRTPARGV